MKTEINYNSKETSDLTKQMLEIALGLVAGKTCIAIGNGNKHRCIDKMVAEIGCNEYNSHITLRGHNNEVEAYFCNGQFWTSITKRLAHLI